MAVSSLDGVIDQVEAGRQYKKVSRFKTITFREEGGQHRTLKNLVARPDIARHLSAGQQARFYIYSALDHKGVHGVRTADGERVFAYPASGNVIVGWFIIAISIVLIALRVAMGDGVPLLSVALIILGGVIVVTTRKSEREARAQFEADNRA